MSSLDSCWECAKRRLVCDLRKPLCKKCAKRGVECPGYDAKPLQWMQPGQTRSKGARKAERLRSDKRLISHAGADSSKPSEPARTTPESAVTVSPVEPEQALVVYPAVTDRSTFSLLIQAMDYHKVKISPDLVATGDRSFDNPFIASDEFALSIPPVMADVIICTALGHRMLQCVPGFERDQKTMALKLRHHRGAAITAVAKDLSNQKAQCHDDTLISVILLLLSEIQHSLSPNWWQHLDGAYAIIGMRGGLPHLISSLPLLRHLFRYFFHIDLFGATTAPGVDTHRAQRQLDVVGSLKVLYGDGLLTSLPCPTELVTCIIFINFLRSRQHSPSPSSTPNCSISLVDNYHPLRQILAFDPSAWASSLSLHGARGSDREDGGKQSPASWDWARVGRVYQSAVALYCVESLDLPPELGPELSNVDIRSTHRDILLQELQFLANSTQAQLRKLVLWPMVIAGLVLNADDRTSRDFVTGELEWLSATLGTAAPLVARDLLRTLWYSSVYSRRGRTWDDLFDRPYAFTI